MLNVAAIIIFITVISQLLQERVKVPASVSAVLFGLIAKYFGIESIVTSDWAFDQIILVLLPILLTVDVLHLKWSDIKRHGWSLFFAAGISVGLAIAAGVAISNHMLPDYNLSMASVVMLMAMCTATDPCSVSAIFSTQKVPKDLKVLAEGESCFNDATALIIFSLALYIETSTAPITIQSMALKSFSVVFGAIAIGAVAGGIGLLMMKITRNAMIETGIMLLTAFSAFAVTEYFHFSGILAIIVAVMLANTVVLNRIEKDNAQIESDAGDVRHALIDKHNHESMQKFIQFLAMIGITVMFLALADAVDFSSLLTYWKEILSVFAATTVIRLVVMAKFSAISNVVGRMHNISISWYKVLVFGGVKGCLSLIMLHLIQDSEAYKPLFEAVVMGVILLTTFIYPIIMVTVIKGYGDKIVPEKVTES